VAGRLVSFLPTPLSVRQDAPLARVTPMTRLVAGAAWLLAAALLSGPRGEALLCGAALIVLVTISGLPLGRLPRRLSPIIVAGAGLGIVAALGAAANSDPAAPALAQLGPLHLSVPGASAGLALALRIWDIGLASVLAFGPAETTRLADGLVQQAHVPDRFAFGTVAAIGLAPLIASDWFASGAARRLRGLEPRGPRGQLIALRDRLPVVLISAFRRAERLALAMDARGFDSGTPRSHYRIVRRGPLDLLIVAGALAIAGAILWIGG
jgi:energy-coupling factor transport system permease protein